MSEQLDRIEKKVDVLTVVVEHRLTAVETTQRGIKWLVGLVAVGAIAVIVAL
jgi:CO dehydrogenase nickel-insertion accessory protein CooC1